MAWFDISTTRKAVWKLNPLDIVLQLSDQKNRHSFELGNWIFIRGFNLSEMYIIFVVLWIALNGYLISCYPQNQKNIFLTWIVRVINKVLKQP